MTATLVTGRRAYGGERDDEGHRTWMVTHLVNVSDPNDGPQIVMALGTLPQVGDAYAFGNDSDTWAFCYPYMKISPHEAIKEGHWIKTWKVEQKFSTKPLKRCADTTIGDPLSEPQTISGSFVKYQKEAVIDRYGNPIRSSSHEPFTGQQVEFDANRPTVKIGQNVASLGLATFAPMVDCVNDSTLWGMSARCVKLSNVSWERKLYGTCSYYYTRNFEFDVDYNGFDRRVVDEGNKVLNGKWDPTTKEWTLVQINGVDPDPNNPTHFIRATDFNGNPIKVPLNGYGVPISPNYTGTGTGNTLVTKLVEKYEEVNFLTLNIPSTL